MMKGVKDNYVDQDLVESYNINNDFLFPLFTLWCISSQIMCIMYTRKMLYTMIIGLTLNHLMVLPLVSSLIAR